MPEFVTTAFVQQYKDNVQMLLQQRESRFQKAVDVQSGIVGKAASICEQIGAVAMQEITTRHADTPLISTPHAKRWVHPHSYVHADLIDNEDQLRMLVDLKSPYARNAMMAANRTKDDLIISAFFGTAKTGENGTTDEAFGGGVVNVATGAAAATGLNVAKLRQARQLLEAAEVDFDYDEIYCGVTSKQLDNLRAEVLVISKDYNDRPVLVNGQITEYMGFKFIHSERLQTGTDDASGTSRAIPVWAKSGMCLGIWADIESKITERADKSYSWQVFTRMTAGATRKENGKVVKIWAREA